MQMDKKIADYFRKYPPEPFTTIQRYRESFEEITNFLNAPFDKIVKVEDIPFPPLTLRMYQPDHNAKEGTVLYFHGGGFVRGSILSHDPFCRKLAHLSGWSIVSVEYRLAPEFPYPTALRDAELAYQWLREKGSRYGLDGVKVVVAGDSSGGTLAARLAQNHRLEIAGELLIYPWLDLSLSFPSYHTFEKGFILEKKRLLWLLEQYLPKGADKKNPDVSPLWEKNLFEIPPTLILAAELDSLIDEGKKYADLLLEHGNEVQYEVFPEMPHGFVLFGKLVKKTLDEFYQKVSDFLSTI